MQHRSNCKHILSHPRQRWVITPKVYYTKESFSKLYPIHLEYKRMRLVIVFIIRGCMRELIGSQHPFTTKLLRDILTCKACIAAQI